MRRISTSLALILGLTIAFAGAASAAGPSGTRTSEERQLVEARNELASQAAQTKGAASAKYDLERRRVDNLIEELKSGRRVSPSRIDDALDSTAHSTPW